MESGSEKARAKAAGKPLISGKGPYYSYPHEYQDVNYGHLYQPVPTDHPQNLHYYQPIPPNQYQQQHVDYYQPVPHNPTTETDRNNYYQPVPDDQNVVTNQPTPVINPVVARRDGSFDKAVIVSICMTGAALLLSSLLLLLCSIPTIYCIYEANQSKDQEVKKKYIRMALCSSAVLMVASFFVMLGLIGLFILYQFATLYSSAGQ